MWGRCLLAKETVRSQERWTADAYFTSKIKNAAQNQIFKKERKKACSVKNRRGDNFDFADLSYFFGLLNNSNSEFFQILLK